MMLTCIIHNYLLDCFVPRNDGDLYRHHSFLQGIIPMPGTRNDALQVPSLRDPKEKMLFSNMLKLTSFRNSPFEGGRGMSFNLSLVGTKQSRQYFFIISFFLFSTKNANFAAFNIKKIKMNNYLWNLTGENLLKQEGLC